MRIAINLASRPFVELRPLFARLRIAMAALAVLAIGLGVGLHYLNAKAQAAEAQMDALTAQTTALQTERETNERRMQQPQNRAVLDRSQLLNAMFARKSFSWTSVMMDLETVLPAGVQVTSIDPVTSAEGDVNIRMRVSGDRDREVDLLRNLEKSQRFLAPRLSNETAQMADANRVAVSAPGMGPGGAAGGVEFEILSGYNPLPPAAKGSVAKDAARKQDEGSGVQTKAGAVAPKRPAKPATKPQARGARGPKITPIQSGTKNGATAGGGR
jgi:type IV pilus assembly protein PilN